MHKIWADVIQASLFTLPRLLVAILLVQIQGAVYVVYNFLGVGIL